MALLLFHYPVLPELTRRYRLHDATESHGYLRPLGRPPFLPHWESFFLCLRVVAVPPFLPMHRGHTMFVIGCIEQYVSLGTALHILA